MVMQAREIEPCLRAIEALPIQKAWFKGWTEAELQEPINDFIQRTDYDNYLMAADDLMPREAEVKVITDSLQDMSLVSGWCNMAPHSAYANVKLRKPYLTKARFAAAMAYDKMSKKLGMGTSEWMLWGLRGFATQQRVRSMPEYFRTYFTGMTLLGMRRKLWLKYPFRVWTNPLTGRSSNSDYVLSQRLNRDGIAIPVAREAFCYHLASRENMILGKVKPSLTLSNL